MNQILDVYRRRFNIYMVEAELKIANAVKELSKGETHNGKNTRGRVQPTDTQNGQYLGRKNTPQN